MQHTDQNNIENMLAKRREPEIAADHYIRLHDLGDDISRHIQNLIDESKKQRTKQGKHDPQRAFRTLVFLAIGIRRGHKPYPKLLCNWMSNVIEETFAEDHPHTDLLTLWTS